MKMRKFTNDDDEPPDIPEEDPVNSKGQAVYQQPFTDMLINAEVLLPHEDEIQPAIVKGRAVDDDGRITGEYTIPIHS